MKISYSLLLYLFLVGCGDKKSAIKPNEKEEPGNAAYANIPAVKVGWDIYSGGVYRYGPSIIVNEDNSIDAWFATPGDVFGERLKNFNDQDDRLPVSLATAINAAQKFTAAEPFYAVQVNCPNWASNNSSLTLSLYAWQTDYQTTLASAAVATKPYMDFTDNQNLELVKETKFPAGDYLWVLHDPAGTPGVWKRNGNKNGITNYLNGEVVAGSYDAWMLVGKTSGAAYWDQVAYRRSTDGGKTWTPDQMVLKPTEFTRDQLSVCDPGVAKWGGYYYLGYTSTEDIRGTDNHVYVCRSKNPAGPWEKWDGNGWGAAPQPVITYTGSPDAFGAGEPSIVVKADKVYFYYSWNADGEEAVTTRLVTASATDENWPAHLTEHGTVINKTNIAGADHCDVKYRDDLKKFQAIHTASRLTAKSYMVLWESADGISFKKAAELRDNLKPFLHNCGWSGDEKGHIDPAKQQFVSYAYGKVWANWNTAWHPLKF